MATMRCPKEGLADALRRIAEHAEQFVIEGLSVNFNGRQYEISFRGAGEVVVDTETGGDGGESYKDSGPLFVGPSE